MLLWGSRGAYIPLDGIQGEFPLPGYEQLHAPRAFLERVASSRAATCGIPFHRHLWDGFLQEGTWGSLSPPGGGSRQAPTLIQRGCEGVLHVEFKGGI